MSLNGVKFVVSVGLQEILFVVILRIVNKISSEFQGFQMPKSLQVYLMVQDLRTHKRVILLCRENINGVVRAQILHMLYKFYTYMYTQPHTHTFIIVLTNNECSSSFFLFF
jgi:hypothetical protein